MREPNAGRIGDSGRDRIDRALTLRLRTQRADRVVCVGEEHLRAQDVGEGGMRQLRNAGFTILPVSS
jgi:hypothetical protein